MIRIIKVSPLPGYRLQVQFEAGVSGTIDLSGDLFGPMFEPLKDEALFGQVRLDTFGVPCWPNGTDIAPEAIYAEITGKRLVAGDNRVRPLPKQKPV